MLTRQNFVDEVERFRNVPSHNYTATDLVPLYGHLYELFKESDYEFVDSFLTNLKIEDFDSGILMLLYRAALPLKIKINGYNNYLKRCYELFVSRNEPAEQYMIGLTQFMDSENETK